MYKLLLSAFLIVVYSSQIRSDLPWTDLRVTWGPVPSGSAFNQVPRTVRDPIFSQQNWTQVSTECENNGTFHGFQHVVSGDLGAALLFDVNGVIAGIQMLLNQSSILGPGNNVNYPSLPVYQSQTLEGQDYFLVTTYFVDPAIICTTGRNDSDLETEGTGTHLLIQNGTNPNGPVVRIPMNRTVAIAEGWSVNQCFPGMGLHNFYKVEEFQSHNCTQVFPFFGLFSHEGELQGFGFANPGTVFHHRFENPSAQAISAIIGPAITPQCILDTVESIGLTSMHVYFIDSPWTITC